MYLNLLSAYAGNEGKQKDSYVVVNPITCPCVTFVEDPMQEATSTTLGNINAIAPLISIAGRLLHCRRSALVSQP